MTIQLVYLGDTNSVIPEDTSLRLTKVNGAEGDFGSAPLVHEESSSRTQSAYHADIHFDWAFGQTTSLTFTACHPDDTERFTLEFTLDYFISADNIWPEPKPTPPQITLAPDVTEPPYSTALVKHTYSLPVKPDGYAHYNTTLRQYADFSTLNVFFFYQSDLPQGAYMRIVSADDAAADYGSAHIGPANVDGTDPSLLNAKIFTQTLPAASTLTVECCAPTGDVLFSLTFNVKDVSYPSGSSGTDGGSSAGGPLTLHTAIPSGPLQPSPNFPLKDAIEDGMQIKPPSTGGFFW